MKKIVIIGVIAVIFAGCGGGSSVDKSISQVNKVIEQIEKKKGNMTDEDWKKMEKEAEEPLKVLTEALENNKVSSIAKMKIFAVTVKWAAVLSEAGMKELEEKTGIDRENFGKELEDAVKKGIEKAAKEHEKTVTE